MNELRSRAALQAFRNPKMAAVISHLQHAALTQPSGPRTAAVQALAKVQCHLLCHTDNAIASENITFIAHKSLESPSILQLPSCKKSGPTCRSLYGQKSHIGCSATPFLPPWTHRTSHRSQTCMVGLMTHITSRSSRQSLDGWAGKSVEHAHQPLAWPPMPPAPVCMQLLCAQSLLTPFTSRPEHYTRCRCRLHCAASAAHFGHALLQPTRAREAGRRVRTDAPALAAGRCCSAAAAQFAARTTHPAYHLQPVDSLLLHPRCPSLHHLSADEWNTDLRRSSSTAEKGMQFSAMV